MKPAIVTFAASGAETGGAASPRCSSGEIFHCGFNGEDAKRLLPRLFGEGRPIIGICAAGILIRLLAPHLGDKQRRAAGAGACRRTAPMSCRCSAATTAANRLAREIAEADRRQRGAHHRLGSRNSPAASTSRRRAGCWPIRQPPSRR